MADEKKQEPQAAQAADAAKAQKQKKEKQPKKDKKKGADGTSAPEGTGKQKKKKMSRKEKKELLKQQLAYEKQLVAEGKIPLRNKYKPRGFFWRVFSICLAFLLGIFGALGGLAATFAIMLGGPSKDLLSTFGLEPEKYLKQAYLEKSVLDIYGDVTKDLNLLADPDELTLATLSKYSPIVDEWIAMLDGNIQGLGVKINWDEFQQQHFKNIVSYAKTSILPNVELGPILELNKDVTLEKINDNAMMYTLCYGSYGRDYTVADGTIQMAEGKRPHVITDLVPTLLDSGEDENANAREGEGGDAMDFIGALELGSFLGLDIRLESEKNDDNTLLYALCYGEEGADFTFDESGVLQLAEGKQATLVNDLIHDANAKLNGLSLGSMLGLNTAENLADRANNALMYTLCYGTEGADWEIDPATGLIKMLGESKPTTVGELTESSNDVVNRLPLGEMLGLNTADSLAKRADNAMMYTLCYGTEGADWEIDPATGLIRMLGESKPTTVGKLTESSNDVVNDLPLGEMLGLNNAEKVADRNGGNALMYAICYGAEGEDYTVNEETGLIEMTDGHAPTTVGDLTENSNDVIDGLYVDAVLGIDPDTSAVLRTVAYGNEMKKGDDGAYLTDPATGKYLTEKVKNDAGEETEQLQYAGGGKYVIETDENGVKSVVMLEDPNAPGTYYKKKTVGDLTAADADLLDGATLGTLLEINDDSSMIMQAIRDWTLDDLKDQDKIESLTIGQILEIDDTSSGIMKALQDKTLAELKDQDTIEGLKIGEILEIDDTSSGIMKALQDKTLAQLKDQDTIEGLMIGQILEISVEDDAEKPADVSNLMWALRKKTVGAMKDQSTINKLKLSDVLEIDGSSSGIMQAMQNWTIGDLNKQSRIERLKIGQIIDLGENPSGIMKAMQDWRISDLNDQKKIDSLTLSDVIEIDKDSSPQILLALADMSLGEISTGIDELTLEDVLGKEAFTDNRILAALRYKQIRELGDAIGNLTIEDVFGDEIYSFAKNYSQDTRPEPTDKVEAKDAVKFHYVGERSEVVEGGWYTGSKDTGYTKIGEGETVVADRYVERKVYLTRQIKYYTVDYDHPDSHNEFVPTTEKIEEDGYGFYYLDQDGNRVDLDAEYSYTLQDGGQPAPEGVRVHEEGEGDVKYFYIEKVDVTYLYAKKSGGQTYEESEVEVGYQTADGTEVTAYFAGVWYLLFDKSELGAATPVTQMGGLVTGIAEKINRLTLGAMYAHEMLDENPELNLTKLNGMGLTTHDNLNELTISEVIQLVESMAGLLG